MLKHKQESPLPPHQAREAAIQINKWLCRLLRDGWTSGLRSRIDRVARSAVSDYGWQI